MVSYHRSITTFCSPSFFFYFYFIFLVLESHFPHKRFSQKNLTDYVTHLLHICKYFPIIQSRIIDLIVSQSLEIDVEIVIEDSGEVKISQEFHDILYIKFLLSILIFLQLLLCLTSSNFF